MFARVEDGCHVGTDLITLPSVCSSLMLANDLLRSYGRSRVIVLILVGLLMASTASRVAILILYVRHIDISFLDGNEEWRDTDSPL